MGRARQRAGARLTDPIDIPVWRRLSPSLTTSGQPSEAGLAAIAALGVRHVVNLALHSHEKALPDEARSVAALGMEYVHIPVEFDAPTEADFAAFTAAMERIGDAPVHVHCIVNARVTAFMYRWELERGAEPAAARIPMDSVWQPGGVWAAFIGDTASVHLPHRGPRPA